MCIHAEAVSYSYYTGILCWSQIAVSVPRCAKVWDPLHRWWGGFLVFKMKSSESMFFFKLNPLNPCWGGFLFKLDHLHPCWGRNINSSLHRKQEKPNSIWAAWKRFCGESKGKEEGIEQRPLQISCLCGFVPQR